MNLIAHTKLQLRVGLMSREAIKSQLAVLSTWFVVVDVRCKCVCIAAVNYAIFDFMMLKLAMK